MKKRRVGTKVWARHMLPYIIELKECYLKGDQNSKYLAIPCPLGKGVETFDKSEECSFCPWKVFENRHCCGLKNRKGKTIRKSSFRNDKIRDRIKRLNRWIKKCKEIIAK